MKVAPPSSKPGVQRKPHVLPLVIDEKADALTKANSITFDVPSTTGDNDSPKYKLSIRVLQGTETARQVIAWKTTALNLLTGLDVTGFAAARTILRQTVKGNALNNFDAAAIVFCELLKEQNIETAEAGGDQAVIDAARAATLDEIGEAQATTAITAAIKGVVEGALPSKALARAKREMRRFMRKPVDMAVRTYVQHLERINAMEIPHLPPFAPNQHLSEDELIDILMFGTPNKWEAEMDRQGFDPYGPDKTLRQVAEFMERLENADEFGQTATQVSTKNGKSSKKRSSGGNQQGPPKKKQCMVHGSCGHSTEECTVVKGLIADKDKSGKKSFQNKWKRSADAATSATKKDLAVLLKQAVKTGAKKARRDMAAMEAKKRKSDDDSSDEEFDLNAMNLDEFNYTNKDIDISDLLEDGEVPLSGKSADC